MCTSKHLAVFLKMLPKQEVFYSMGACSWEDGEACEAEHSIHLDFCRLAPMHSCSICVSLGVTSVKAAENVPDLVRGRNRVKAYQDLGMGDLLGYVR